MARTSTTLLVVATFALVCIGSAAVADTSLQPKNVADLIGSLEDVYFSGPSTRSPSVEDLEEEKGDDALHREVFDKFLQIEAKGGSDVQETEIREMRRLLEQLMNRLTAKRKWLEKELTDTKQRADHQVQLLQQLRALIHSMINKNGASGSAPAAETAASSQ